MIMKLGSQVPGSGTRMKRYKIKYFCYQQELSNTEILGGWVEYLGGLN